MSRRRTLHPEERDIWDQVARTARPLHTAPPKRTLAEKPLPKPPIPRVPEMPAPSLSDFRIGTRSSKPASAPDLSPALAQQIGQAPLRMDAGTHKAMRRGKILPEARLDLHGLTLAEAHPELIRFLLNAHAAGMRLVLVITGKGKDRDTGGPIPARTGALRHQVPQWLRLPPLAGVVLQLSQAHLKHGGGGAYYIYLKRRR